MNKAHQTNIVILIILSIITTSLGFFLCPFRLFSHFSRKQSIELGTWTWIDPILNTVISVSLKLWFNTHTLLLQSKRKMKSAQDATILLIIIFFLIFSVDNVNLQREEERKSVLSKEPESASASPTKQFGKLAGLLVKSKL